MKSIRFLGVLLLTVFFLASCDSGPSLQKYIVDSKEKPDFMAVDVPASMLNLEETDLGPEEQEAYRSLKKLNILAFKLHENNKDQFEEEKATIKKILANERYNDLIKFSDQGARITIKYLGTDEAIDEVIFYGYKNDKGLMLGRVLGEDMNLRKASQLVSAVRSANIDAGAMAQLQGMFNQ